MGILKSDLAGAAKAAVGRNFSEKAGLSKRVILEEARRCPQCTDPVCRRGCPLGIDIPGFIRHLREGDFIKAAATIREESLFAAICGRVCPAPCEKACIFSAEGKPIPIRALERCAADHDRAKPVSRRDSSSSGKKVAVAGSGPAGLMAASSLVAKGYSVDVFETFPFLGGVLRYGVLPFRLPQKVVTHQVNAVKAEGVVFHECSRVGETVMINQLFEQGFAAVLLAAGSGGARVPEDRRALLGGVYLAEEILVRANMVSPSGAEGVYEWQRGERVVVVGADYPALDCARMFVRLGLTVSLVLPGTDEDLAVHRDDRQAAINEGVQFVPLAHMKELAAGKDHFVAGIKCERMDFADPTNSGKWTLVPVPDSEFTIEADTVVISGGRRPNDGLPMLIPEIKTGIDGRIWIDEETGMTSLAGVFACGDLAGTCPHIAEAFSSGKQAAVYIDQYLQ